MEARHFLAALAVVTAILGVGCSKQTDRSDEVWDFASTTSSTPSGTPYDVYEDLTRTLGVEKLAFADAEATAASLCASLGDRLGGHVELEQQEVALIRAYCPELEPGT